MRPSYGGKLAFWELKKWPMEIISRWLSYPGSFDRENNRGPYIVWAEIIP